MSKHPADQGRQYTEAEIIVIEELLRSHGWRQNAEFKWINPMNGEVTGGGALGAYEVFKTRKSNMTHFALKDEFTAIVFKHDSVDTVRGCEMNRYSSSMDLLPCRSCYELIEELAHYLSKELGIGESGYEVILVSTVNGQQVIHEDFVDNGSAQSSLDDWSVEIDRVYDAIRRAIKERVKEIVDHRERMKKIGEIHKADAARRAKEIAERAELARLKVRYPDG